MTVHLYMPGKCSSLYHSFLLLLLLNYRKLFFFKEKIVADHCEYKKLNMKKIIFENNLFKLHTVFLHQKVLLVPEQEKPKIIFVF